MTELEKQLKAKIPGKETGIEVKHTICDICAPGFHCGIDAYVKDGKVIKIEGTKGHPLNNGLLCTKGASNRQYIYRKDRLKTPLRRVGPKGSGEFVEITWDEAYTEIAAKLNDIKSAYGPDSVAFFSGYSKWYRPFLHRLAYSFGSINYGSECSTCFHAGMLAWLATAGTLARPDFANCKTFLGWACNPFHSSYLVAGVLDMMKEKGVHIVIIDPRITPTSERYADLHLRLRPGTDGALALGLANVIIQNGWQDMDYIRENTVGFEEFAKRAAEYPLERVAEITGLNPEDIYTAAKWYATEGPAACNEAPSTLVHHRNGFQAYRAICCLSALTGNFDRPGGSVPVSFSYIEQTAGFHTRDEEFYQAVYPKSEHLPIGGEEFPVWNHYEEEFQAMALPGHIHNPNKSYPIKGLVSFGMNINMFPGSFAAKAALKELDFFVNTELFMTETCKYADIVLPACSSFERSEFKTYMGGYAVLTKPVIAPLYNSKPDTEIIRDLAEYLELDDELLKAGYRKWIEYIIEPLSLTMEELDKSDLPVFVKDFKPFVAGDYTRSGFKTPSGKFEFKSSFIQTLQDRGFDPLPGYTDIREGARGSFQLISGVRLPNALHSRLHKVPWLRSLRPDPMADISREDAQALDIKSGDLIEIYNEQGSITVKANVSRAMAKGTLAMYHGYEEKNINLVVRADELDPYSGYPAYKSTWCEICKASGGPKE